MNKNNYIRTLLFILKCRAFYKELFLKNISISIKDCNDYRIRRLLEICCRKQIFQKMKAMADINVNKLIMRIKDRKIYLKQLNTLKVSYVCCTSSRSFSYATKTSMYFSDKTGRKPMRLATGLKLKNNRSHKDKINNNQIIYRG